MMTDTAGTRTRDRSDDEPWVVAGVDTHKDTHHVAVLNAATGAGLGDMRVPATPAGYDQPRDFVRSHGRIRMIGIEGTGSYGAGPARALRAAGAPIREVIRPKRPQRRRGKSDPIDAYAAAGRALAEADALPVAKTGTGPCEQIRVLLVERRSAMKARVAAHRQITALLTTAPDAVRTRFARLSGEGAHRRPGPHAPRPGHPPPPHRRPRERCAAWPAATGSRADEIADIDTELRALTARAAPTMLATKALRRQPPPPRSPAPATTPAESAPRPPSPPCAAPPRSPPAPGKTNRHRLNRGGDRQANREPHPNAPPARRPAHQGLRRPPHRHGQELQRDTALPQTRHRPRSMAPADPPPTRTPHRRPAPTAPRTRTHPHPSRPPPEHPPGPDQRTRTRHTPRHHPHRSIPPMAQHPTTTDPHRLTPIGASRPRPSPSHESHMSHRAGAHCGEPQQEAATARHSGEGFIIISGIIRTGGSPDPEFTPEDIGFSFANRNDIVSKRFIRVLRRTDSGDPTEL